MTPKSSPRAGCLLLSANERRRPLQGDWCRRPPLSCGVPPLHLLLPNPLSPRANFLLQVTLSCRIGVRGEEDKRRKSGESCGKNAGLCVSACVCAGVLPRHRVSNVATAFPFPPPLSRFLQLPDGYDQLCGLLSDNCSLLIYNVKLNDSLGPAPSGP